MEVFRHLTHKRGWVWWEQGHSWLVLHPETGVVAILLATVDLEYPPAWVMFKQVLGSSFLSRQSRSALWELWHLAGQNQRLTGIEKGSKMKPVSLIKVLGQEKETQFLTSPRGLKLYVTVITRVEVGSFPGKWEMRIRLPAGWPGLKTDCILTVIIQSSTIPSLDEHVSNISRERHH